MPFFGFDAEADQFAHVEVEDRFLRGFWRMPGKGLFVGDAAKKMSVSERRVKVMVKLFEAIRQLTDWWSKHEEDTYRGDIERKYRWINSQSR